MVTFHLVYIGLAVPLTVWLALTLFRNGQLFLADVFPDRPELARALNHLLVTGFFMLNLGWALLLIREQAIVEAGDGVRLLANRLGVLLLTLGAVHFVNLYVFERIRRGRRVEQEPPTPPNWFVPQPGPDPRMPGGPRAPMSPTPVSPMPAGAVHGGPGDQWGPRGPASTPPR